MQDIPLTQDELKLIVGVLSNVSLKPVDGYVVFDLIRKLDGFITKSPETQPTETKTDSKPETNPN